MKDNRLAKFNELKKMESNLDFHKRTLQKEYDALLKELVEMNLPDVNLVLEKIKSASTLEEIESIKQLCSDNLDRALEEMDKIFEETKEVLTKLDNREV